MMDIHHDFSVRLCRKLTKCRPNIIYQLTSNNFESEGNLLLSTGITVYFTQATLLNNID
jgi:hypothetical protein